MLLACTLADILILCCCLANVHLSVRDIEMPCREIAAYTIVATSSINSTADICLQLIRHSFSRSVSPTSGETRRAALVISVMTDGHRQRQTHIHRRYYRLR